MRIGDLRHKLIVQKPTEAQDAGGEPDTTWSEFDQVWGSRMAVGGTETLGQTGVMTGVREELEIRYRAGVTPKMRILARAEDTTLNGSISATDLVLIVTSSASFPLEAEFRVLIESEILTVTAGWGTTSWAVTRGTDSTTAATHASGVVLHRLEVLDVETVVDPTGRRAEMRLTGVVNG